MADNSSQIVYVLTNPAMPGLVKIGKTTQLEVSERMKQLYSTGVPVPFDCAFACQVKDASEVEKALHFAFGRDRTNPNREFFSIEAERVIAVLKLLKVDDITTQFEQQRATNRSRRGSRRQAISPAPERSPPPPHEFPRIEHSGWLNPRLQRRASTSYRAGRT